MVGELECGIEWEDSEGKELEWEDFSVDREWLELDMWELVLVK